ncbi:amid-like NADH oxidoreductase [Xylogone sp. PMI_703]|nr:amid-like NADH oxidoreductase [Xylogone sp. PMI_703]
MLGRILAITRIVGIVVHMIVERLGLIIEARIHRHTYKAVESPRNVVVIGGSFAGHFLATKLANSLPTGYRVVLIEKKSHFNFTWLFPRISVIAGHEHKGFIPYGPSISALPAGSIHFHRGTAIAISDKAVTLQDGASFEYEYLAIATGSTGCPPWHLGTEDKLSGIAAFQHMQKEIQESQDIIVVGGGAVGVELATDAKSAYPDKNITLVHSRQAVLHSFGQKLQVHAMRALEELGVNVVLGERVSEESEKTGSSEITLKSGKTIRYDLLIKCTGQTPSSSILSALSPASISDSGIIMVKKTLQIIDDNYPRIYALGDVAATGGARMGRAASLQGFLVADNIVRAIKGRQLRPYKPISIIEGGIDLTLGLDKGLTYFRDGKEEFLIKSKKKIDLNSKQCWELMGARPYEDEDYDLKAVRTPV